MGKFPKASKLLHMLLIKLYWATAVVWVAIMLIGLLKADGRWTVDMLEDIAPSVLCILGVAFIHWFILYRKEIKNDSSN